MHRALKTCDVKREACEKELKRLVERREGLRGDKEKMEEKDRLKQRADALNKCYKWISFRKNQKMAIQLRAEKQEKEAELEAAGVSMTPFTSRSEGLRALGQNRDAAVAEGGALWKKSRAKVARAEGKVEAASDLVMTRSAEAEALEQKRGELERSRAKSQLDLSQALEAGAVDVSALKEEISSLVGRMRDAKRAQEESARVAHALRRDLVEVNREVYDSEQRLQAMTNKESQRFNRLRSSRMPNARTACEVRAWLEHNRGKFTGRVFGPLILEVSVEDEGIAAIVEQQCLPHVQLTFVVENDHDQKLLLSEWKEGRRANIVVQQLRKFGWDTGQNGVEGDSTIEHACESIFGTVREYLTPHTTSLRHVHPLFMLCRGALAARPAEGVLLRLRSEGAVNGGHFGDLAA